MGYQDAMNWARNNPTVPFNEVPKVNVSNVATNTSYSDYYTELAKTLVGTSGYEGMTAGQIERERRRESGNIPRPATQKNAGSEGTSFNDTIIIYPTPPTPPPILTPSPNISVKTAPIDTVLFDDESVPIEVITDLLFENIGAHELITISRNDIINGQNVSYNLIKNLSSIQQQYNPNNILSLQSTSSRYFANFPIKFETKIPKIGSGPEGAYVYLDENTGNLIIETENIEIGEEIEVQITSSGTIYEAEFGESNS
jgi:hypothetical protein